MDKVRRAPPDPATKRWIRAQPEARLRFPGSRVIYADSRYEAERAVRERT